MVFMVMSVRREGSGLGDLDLAFHARFMVTWVKTGEVHVSWCGELPDNFSLRAWCQGYLVGFIMRHVR
jgi:hypothetical protein